MQVVKRMASTTKMLTLKIFIPSRRRDHDGATWMKVLTCFKTPLYIVQVYFMCLNNDLNTLKLS